MRRLKTRAEFVAVARGRRASRNGIVLQALKTGVEDTGVGFTVTKKAGNAPERSRIKRRLRAAVCACNTPFHPNMIMSSWDGATSCLRRSRALSQPLKA